MLWSKVMLMVLLVPLAAWGQGSLDFDLYNLDQTVLFRMKQVRQTARVVAVDFFSVSCRPCRDALPQWVKLHRQYASRGLVIVVVAMADEDDRDMALDRLDAHFLANPLPFQVVYDKYGLVASRYGVLRDGKASLPQMFLLAPSGQVIRKSQDMKDTVAQLRATLGE